MRERPPLSDGALAATLADGWGVAAASVEFLPVGNDSRAWSFGVVAADGSRRFCKLRRGPVGPGAVRVPMVLREQGLEEVMAAVPHGGRRAVAAAGRLHPAAVPVGGGQAGDGAGVERPAVDRPRPVRGRAAPDRAAGGAGGDGDRLAEPLRHELAGLWRAHRTEIGVAADRAQRLGRVVAAARPALVLCHGDLHTANLLVGADDLLAVVDWDGLLLAPRERDLMFVTGEERTRFLEGYGPATLDRTVLAYTRWEWVVQELADYGTRVLDDRLGEQTRRQAVAEFARLFAPGDVGRGGPGGRPAAEAQLSPRASRRKASWRWRRLSATASWAARWVTPDRGRTLWGRPAASSRPDRRRVWAATTLSSARPWTSSRGRSSLAASASRELWR